ncbi:MAG: acetolactate synthase large subunit [Candidatus Micrarchaeota archaeon]|nr:acetolactate synthase large subunit [Candidatus Micrarchaeota archaeon]
MNSANLMVKCLENEGVEYIFGLPGEENLELMESLSNSNKIKFVTARHEQGAAFMADVYGRIRYKPGICLATLGPGALNLMTGVASANLDHSPLVAITGQADFKEMHKEQHQYIDIVGAFRPITKWNTRISSPDSVPEVVRKAFRIATTEKFGATHIEFANDIAKSETTAQPLKIVKNAGFCSEEEEVKKAAGLITNAKYPIILCGNGVVRTQYAKELIAFAELSGIPVAKTFMSKGAIPGIHPLSLGTIGLKSRDYILEEFEKADLVITVGYDMVEYSPSYWNPDKNKTIIAIDSISEKFVDVHLQFDVELVGDIKCNLNKLGKLLKKRQFTKPEKLKEAVRKEREDFEISYPLKAQHVLSALRKVMKEDDILVSDVGEHKLLISRLFPTTKPNTVVISNGLASMGIALPGAIGAKFAAPDHNVFAVNGDGGFLMNVQELETAKRMNIPFVCIIVNDGSYGMIEKHQVNQGKKIFGTKIGNPDFVKLAESFGARGYRVEKASEIDEILKQAVKSKELCVIDVPIKY